MGKVSVKIPLVAQYSFSIWNDKEGYVKTCGSRLKEAIEQLLELKHENLLADPTSTDEFHIRVDVDVNIG